MKGRISLVEQKRQQWAREREEMARLCAPWGSIKRQDLAEVTIRSRMSSTDGTLVMQPGGNLTNDYGSIVNLRGLGTDSPKSHVLGASLVSLQDATLQERPDNIIRHRSPSLPPIHTKEPTHLQKQFDPEGSRYHGTDQKFARYSEANQNLRQNRYGSPREDREGETSGYASDSAEVPVPVGEVLPNCTAPGTAMSDNAWQHLKNYCPTPESSLPPSRRLSAVRGGPELRPRWGSLWGQDAVKVDPPPPSWLERGLSRLDHTSQVLVINHESASSPDSSSTGSAGSDSNQTYLRGQNVPVDADVLQEREIRRQKALELQIAIKRQLEERERQRKEEQQQRLQEERAEEERIRREREKEKERFEEEQRKLKEKENAKHKKEEAMREVLEAAERLTKEKKSRRKREADPGEAEVANEAPRRREASFPEPAKHNFDEIPVGVNLKRHNYKETVDNQEVIYAVNQRVPESLCVQDEGGRDDRGEGKQNHRNNTTVQLPVGKEIAIVLSGRLDDPEILNTSNLKVNLVMQSPRGTENKIVEDLRNGDFFPSLNSPGRNRTHQMIQRRLLTPSKYRSPSAREFGTQTDLEDIPDHPFAFKQSSSKERKESINANRRDIEKSTNTGHSDYSSTKPSSRSKVQSRTSLEARPRWNANRPGTRYRTQSEKDPHYQRRLRLRQRQVDSSDERSRSPSPERRKHNSSKTKMRSVTRRKFKLDSYDADLSMDSLNSIVPLRVDKNGRVNIDSSKLNLKPKCDPPDCGNEKRLAIKETNVNLDAWCGRELLTQLTTLRNGLLMKKQEWDSERCLVSPSSEFY